MPPLMFHHFSGHLPRTRKLCKFCKMMDQNFQTKPINPAKKILVICLGKTVFPLTLPKHFHFCRNCQTDCFHFQQFLPMLDIFSYTYNIYHCQDNSYGRTKTRGEEGASLCEEKVQGSLFASKDGPCDGEETAGV